MAPYAPSQIVHVHYDCPQMQGSQFLMWWSSKVFNGYVVAYIKEKMEIIGVN